jgi:hypothetical protein
MLCACFLFPCSQQKAWSPNVAYMVVADARCVGRIDGEPELATNAEEESEQGEVVLDCASRHCNEWVGCGGGQDAWEEGEVFKVIFVDVIVDFGLNDGGGVFLYAAPGAVGERVERKYWARFVQGVVGGQAVATSCGRMWW